MKFHDVAVQNNVKEMYKKVCCTVMQSCFFDQLDVLIFLPISLLLLVNITQFYFFLFELYKLIKSTLSRALLLALAKSLYCVFLTACYGGLLLKTKLAFPFWNTKQPASSSCKV